MQDGSSAFGLVALVAGGVVGALLRMLLARAVPAPRPLVSWSSETGLGLVLGVVLAVAFVLSGDGGGPVSSGLGGAMTAYSGACGVYAFGRVRGTQGNPTTAAVVRFLAALASTAAGYVALIGIWTAGR